MEIHAQDFITIGILIFLEGILSIDNALALALIAKHLPKNLQRRALTYGLVGAVAFRLGALAFVQYLVQWNWVKFAGGGYLVYMSLAHFLSKKDSNELEKATSVGRGFWATVILIELTDIAFAADSILAAVALSNKLWIVVTGGVIGLILMRFAANFFITLLDRFPNFEFTAYALVLLVGVKLIVDGLKLPGIDFHSLTSPAFWSFWLLCFILIALGFKKKKPSV